jgi:cyclophilin family peptidyl-prolyl cis-trans isomerase
MNTSNPTAKPAAPAPLVSDDPLQDGVEAFFDKVRDNPRPYIAGVVGVGLAALVLLVGFRTWRDSKESKLTDISAELIRAGSAGNSTERVSILNELKKRTEGLPAEGQRLFLLSVAYRDLAEQATSNEEKKAAWENCLAATNELAQKFPNSLWVKMPSRPGSTEAKSANGSLKSLAEEQLRWLSTNPYVAAAAADQGLSVTFELEDGRKIKVGKLYSKSAPYAVQNFVNLARDGYFDGLSIGNLKKWYRKAAATTGEQSIVGAEFGDAMTRATPDNRDDDNAEPDSKNDLPYSLPDEPSSLAIGRGSLVARPNNMSGGTSPTRFTIYVDEIAFPTGAPFGEVTEGLDVLEAVLKGETDAERTDRLKTPVKIKSAKVEGSVQNPPTGRALPKYTPEMLPKGEEKKPEAGDASTKPK